jgi:hypothetical protein
MSSAAATPALGRSNAQRALATSRMRMARNRLRRGQARRGRLALRVALVGSVVLVLAISVAVATLGGVEATDEAGGATAVLTAIFALAVLGGFVGAAGTALQAFYLSADLPFLLSLPIPFRVIFSAKFAESMVGCIPAALILVAALAGYGLGQAERWWYLLAALLVVALILAGTTALTILVVALIGRLLPPRRAGPVLVLISLSLVVAVWAAVASLTPEITAAASAAGPETEPLGVALATAGERIAWTPVGWAARAVVGAAEGEAIDALVSGGLFLLTVAGAVAAASTVFVATFAHVYGGYRATTIAFRRTDRRLGRWVERGLHLLPGPLAALVLKEWLTMIRDLRRLSGAVWPLGMVGIYTVLLSRGEQTAPAGAPDLAFWIRCGTLALVPWGASLGISIYAFGTERRQIHLLRSLPVGPSTILRAKVLASLVPVLVLGEAAATIVGLAQGATPGQHLGLAALVAWASVGYVLIDTAAAAIAPNFEAEQVQRSTGVSGRLVGFIAGAVFTLASGAAAARLIFYAAGTPDALRPALTWEIAGLTPLGWPLVAFAATVALLDVVLFASIAERRVAEIIQIGE